MALTGPAGPVSVSEMAGTVRPVLRPLAHRLALVGAALATGPVACLSAADAPGPTRPPAGRDAGSRADRDAGSAGDAHVDGAPAVAPLAEVRLNEVMCRGREWIELVNLSESSAALGGWVLSDDLEQEGHSFVFPDEGPTLEPGSFAVVSSDELPFRIKCDGETLQLLSPDGEVEVDAVTVVEPPQRATVGRLPDGTGDWVVTEPTPGEPNRLPSDRPAAVFDPERVHTVDLQLEERDMDRLRREPYEYVEGRFRFTPEDGEPDEWLDVGLRIKGRAGSLRELDEKPAFKVDFDRFGNDGQTFRGLAKLTLNNAVQDPSALHEWLAYLILREAGVPAPRTGHARVRLNGLDYGLYVNLESLDKAWLEKRFASTKHLYEGLYGQDLNSESVGEMEVDVGNPDDRRDLWDIVDLAQEPSRRGFYAASQELVNWDEVLTMMATEIYIGHWDGYAPTRNNYFFHLDDTGRLSLLPWGTDQTFAHPLHLHRGQGLLLSYCLEDDACRLRYDEAIGALVDTLDGLDLVDRLDAQADRIEPHVRRDPRREHPMEVFHAVVDQTRDFLRDRRAQVGELLRCLLDPNGGDHDGDGFRCDDDCDDGDPRTHPGADDTCGDQRDQDCNGRPDDGPECPDCVLLEREADDAPRTRYLFCTTPRSFQRSRRHCQEEGEALDPPGEFDLTVVNTRDEDWWLHRRAADDVLRQDYWIGLTDRQEEGEWIWLDGTPLRRQLANWGEGEPNNAGNEDCVHQWADGGQWNDLPCDEERGAMCEEICPPGQLGCAP